jgi:molybdenum cofactor cytidylyltransferase
MTQNSQQKKEISGIILAAGTGSRIKTVKQLLPYAGKPLLQHVINSARSSNLSKIITVLGYRAREIRSTVDFTGTEVVVNHYYKTGLGGSIRIGLSIVPEHHRAALFILGDQPLISADLLNSILLRFERSQAPIIVPRYQGKRGNPVLVAKPLFGRLYQLSGDTGGRQLFSEYDKQIDYLETDDPSILFDVDTQVDYNLLLNQDRE